jgi:hypothetical protein
LWARTPGKCNDGRRVPEKEPTVTVPKPLIVRRVARLYAMLAR